MARTSVFIVSPPRSGHTMLGRFLDVIFDPLPYCEMYRCKDAIGRPISCPAAHLPAEQKNGCHAGRMIQKSHDFDLRLPNDPSCRYVVIVRSPVPSLTSWFRLATKQTTGPTRPLRRETFLLVSAHYWRRFTSKWTISPAPNVMISHYETLVRDAGEIRRIAAFIDPTLPPDRLDRLTDEMHAAEIRADRRLETEPDYDPALYAACEQIIGTDYIRALGLKPLGIRPSIASHSMATISGLLALAAEVRQRYRQWRRPIGAPPTPAPDQ